jgi:activator of HSP90 ATPase
VLAPIIFCGPVVKQENIIMNKAIEQTIQFENTTPEELFDMYTNPQKHGALLGAEVVVTKEEGDLFSAFNGNVTGINLLVVPGRMIVQSWRGNVWTMNDLDSILILTFTATKKGAQVYMVHANTPDQFDELWDEFYWQPMKELIKKG